MFLKIEFEVSPNQWVYFTCAHGKREANRVVKQCRQVLDKKAETKDIAVRAVP